MNGTYSKPPRMISAKSNVVLRGDYSGPMPERKGVTQKDMEFMLRMDADIDQRRTAKFVNELSAPHLQPSTIPTVAALHICRACFELSTQVTESCCHLSQKNIQTSDQVCWNLVRALSKRWT
jgi:hypothetical protein